MFEQIAEFLAQGFKQAQVAEFTGVDPSYISQLLKEDEKFREILRQKMIIHQDNRIDSKYNALEEATINALKGSIETAEIKDQVRVLEGIARVKQARKSIAIPGANNGFGHVTNNITLTFKSDNAPKLVMDDANRVIAIGEATVMPMPARAVRDMFAKMDEQHVLSAPSPAS